MPAQTAQKLLSSIPVDKSSPMPIYLQIVDGLRGLIKGGKLRVRTQLPPERVLCAAYGVSRMTLRQAMGMLESEGLIDCQRGRGTFVAQGRLQKQQQELRSFTEEILARGSVPTSRLLSFRLIAPPPEAQEFFATSQEARIYEICRIRLSDGQPLALEAVLIPEQLCPNLDRFDLTKSSLYRILEDPYGLQLDHCVEEISAIRPNRLQRENLNLPPSAAVLLIKRKTYASDDRPMEIATTAYRGDSFTAIVRSVRGRK